MEKTREKQPRREEVPEGGSDARLFGQGGQKVQGAFNPGHDDKPDRDPERDESLPSGEHPSRRKR